MQIDNKFEILEEIPTRQYGKEVLKETREIIIGTDDKITFIDKEGARWGNKKFADANAWIKNDGSSKFKSVIISSSAGDTLIDTTSSTGDYVHVLNTKLNTDSQEILKDFDFGTTDYAGAVKAGDITWNTSTGAVTGGSGVVVYKGGIIGAKSGSTTFSINTSGDATFKGTVQAGSVLSAGDITAGGTITGVDVVSSTDSNRVALRSGNYFQIVVGGTEKGRIYGDSSGDLYLQGVDDVTLRAGGSDRVTATSSAFRPNSDGSYDLGTSSRAYRYGYIDRLYVDEIRLPGDWKINKDSSGNLCVYYDGDKYMKIDKGDGDLHIQSSGSFKSDL